MKRSSRLIAGLFASMLVVTLALPAVADDITTGGFVQKLARQKQLDATDVQTAVDSLAAIGIRLPADLQLNRRLTEGDVTRISRAAGLNVTTARPSAVFDAARVDQFFNTFAYDLGPGNERSTDSGDQGSHFGGDGNGPPFNPFGKGKGKGDAIGQGKGKGLNFTPTEAL